MGYLKMGLTGGRAGILVYIRGLGKECFRSLITITLTRDPADPSMDSNDAWLYVYNPLPNGTEL
jgi:hypothetical protein